MGLFTFFKYTDSEKLALKQLDGLGLSQKGCLQILDEIIEESKGSGSYYFPNCLGDLILSNSQTGQPELDAFIESVYIRLPIKRKEGVEDIIIKEYWNHNDVIRRMTERRDDMIKLISFYYRLEDLKESEEVALTHIQRNFPLYGNPNDTSNFQGNDRLLPIELRFKINDYAVKNSAALVLRSNMSVMNSKSFSFNSWIRSELQAGNI